MGRCINQYAKVCDNYNDGNLSPKCKGCKDLVKPKMYIGYADKDIFLKGFSKFSMGFVVRFKKEGYYNLKVKIEEV